MVERKGKRSSAGKILVVAGTRPEVIKLAPVIHALGIAGLPPRICATGQHDELANDAFAQFGIMPHICLDLMRHGERLSAFKRRATAALARVIEEEQPDWVIVQGDTGSALCATIAAHDAGAKIAHVEAGLRSFNWRAPFPEELYRTKITSLVDLHFAPTHGARANLIAEGVAPDRIEVTGNSVVDALRWIETHVAVDETGRMDATKRIIVTTHRRENRGSRMAEIVKALTRLAQRADIHLTIPVHPGVRRDVFATLEGQEHVRLCAPLPYAEFIGMLANAHLVITDSGGMQEEACALGIPTLITRANTERPEVIEAGTARIIGTSADAIFDAACDLLDNPGKRARMALASTRIGDGRAGFRIARRLRDEIERNNLAA